MLSSLNAQIHIALCDLQWTLGVSKPQTFFKHVLNQTARINVPETPKVPLLKIQTVVKLCIYTL